MPRNKIGDDGISSIALLLREPLSNHFSLVLLNLEDNRIGDKGAVELSMALDHSKTLREVNLGRNRIGETDQSGNQASFCVFA